MSEVETQAKLILSAVCLTLSGCEHLGVLVVSNVLGLFKSKKMLWGCDVGKEPGPGFPWEAAGKAVLSPSATPSPSVLILHLRTDSRFLW